MRRWKKSFLSIHLLFLVSYLLINGYIYHAGMTFISSHPEITRYTIGYHEVPPFSFPEKDGSITIQIGNYPSFFYIYSVNEQDVEGASYLFEPSVRKDYIQLNRRTENAYKGLITVGVVVVIISIIMTFYAIFQQTLVYGYILTFLAPILIVFRKGMLSWEIVGIVILYGLGLMLCMKGKQVHRNRLYLFPWIQRKKKDYRFHTAYDEKRQ